MVIPKLITRDGMKLFFFGSQEFTNDARPVETVIANLPTEAERRGDFSNTRQTNGALLIIRDPADRATIPGKCDSPGSHRFTWPVAVEPVTPSKRLH